MSRHGNAASARPRLAAWLAALAWLAGAAAFAPAPAAAEAWRVRDGYDLNARSGPGAGHAVVETLRPGTVVEEIGRDGSWSRVRTPAGNVAFVHNGYLAKSSRSGESVPSGTGVSASRFRMHANTDLLGGDLTQDGHRDVSLAQCEAICARASECRGYTYVDAKRWCWPKSNVSNPEFGKPGLTSAVREAPSVDSPAWRVMDGYDLNARSGPGTGHAVVETLRPGTVVAEIDRDGSWSRVRTPAGHLAFVHNWYLVEHSPSDGSVSQSQLADSRDVGLPAWQVALNTGHTDHVTSVAFSPDGRTIATGSEDGTARLWDAGSGRLLNIFGSQGGVFDLAFSPDGQQIVVAGPESYPTMWDTNSGRLSREFKVQEFRHGTLAVAFSPDGRHVAFGGGNSYKPWNHGALEIWDVKRGTVVRDLQRNWDDVREEFPDILFTLGWFYSVAFSPDGRMVATMAEEGVGLWSTDSNRWLRVFAGENLSLDQDHRERSSSLALSPDGRHIATGADDGTVRILDVQSGRAIDELHGHEAATYAVTFSPDGRRIAAGAEDGTVLLWDARNGHAIRKLHGHEAEVRAVAFSPDGRYIATGASDGMAFLWEADSGLRLRELGGGNSQIHSVAFGSDDGQMMATALEVGTAHLWDAHAGSQQRVITIHEGAVRSVALSPDERMILTGSDDGIARLWDVRTGRQLHEIGDFAVSATAFSPDGRIMATGGKNRKIALWDSESGREIRVLEVPDPYDDPDDDELEFETWSHGEVDNIAFNLDGRTIQVDAITYHPGTAGDVSRSFHVFDAVSGDIVCEHEWYEENRCDRRVREVAIGLNGRVIANASEEGSVRLLDAFTRHEVAQFVSFADGSWIVLTPEGFFNASEDGAKHLNLVRGLEVLSIDQVYDALFRPDLVREALAGDPDGKVAAAAARLDLGKVLASGLPPRVLELRSLDGDAVEGDAVELSVEIEDRGGGIGRVEWRVNGVVQGAGSRGLGGLEVEDGGAFELRKRLFLAPGENTVSVTAYNAAGLIASDPVEITLASRQGSVARPKLHVLAVGIDDYFDSRLELNYAVSDARALGTALKKAGRDLYDAVEVTYLLDEAVSVEGLGTAFEALGRAVRPQDVFVLFLAGHGKTLDGRYHFLPRDFRYRDADHLREAAVSQQQLQSWLSQVAAQKSVLLFDTCESGSLTQEAVTRGLEDKAAIERLSRAVGRTTLTASTDTGPALEGYRQHGLFTYALLEALAKGDADGDNQVEIDEMIGYVDERLPELSEAAFGHRQVPQHSSRGSFFPLGRPVTILSETEEDLIPRAPTHVVISEADAVETLGDLRSVIETFAPGVTVRVVEQANAWARIAVDGVSVGWVETARLAILQ